MSISNSGTVREDLYHFTGSTDAIKNILGNHNYSLIRHTQFTETNDLQEAQNIADNDPVHLFAINKAIRGRVLSNGALIFIEQLLHLAIVYKNKSWKNESEWRHVILTKRSSNHQFDQFLGYSRPNYLYIKLPSPRVLYFSNFSNHLFNAGIKQRSKNIELAYYPCDYRY